MVDRGVLSEWLWACGVGRRVAGGGGVWLVWVCDVAFAPPLFFFTYLPFRFPSFCHSRASFDMKRT